LNVGKNIPRPINRCYSDAEKIAKETAIEDVQLVIGDGSPVKEIPRHAEEDAANLIVMGSRGLGDLQGLLMGSVSHKVCHFAKQACITVR
jgi:nucleotide-binding universal stress UspA family protein